MSRCSMDGIGYEGSAWDPSLFIILLVRCCRWVTSQSLLMCVACLQHHHHQYSVWEKKDAERIRWLDRCCGEKWEPDTARQCCN